MYLFARTATVKPERSLDAITFATEICGQVKNVTGQEVHAWTALYGVPINTLTWTTMVESHADMGAAGEKLQADGGYMSRVTESSDLFETAPEDVFAEVLATVNQTDQLGTYASVIVAQCAPGKIAEAMGWGVDIFNHVGQVTGRPGILSRSLYGPFAQMSWISLADTLDQVDAAGTAMNSDPKYIEMIDQGTPLFVPGSGSGRLTQRLA